MESHRDVVSGRFRAGPVEALAFPHRHLDGSSVRGTVQVSVRKGKRLNWPRAETPTHYIAMGLHPDLNEAARLGVREAIDFLTAEKGIPRDEAYILCSIGVDLHVTQLVDGT